jgi:hypothetical protein
LIVYWRAPRISQRTPKDELNLRVQAPEIIIRPPLNRVQQIAVHPQEKRLPLGHRCSYW